MKTMETAQSTLIEREGMSLIRAGQAKQQQFARRDLCRPGIYLSALRRGLTGDDLRVQLRRAMRFADIKKGKS